MPIGDRHSDAERGGPEASSQPLDEAHPEQSRMARPNDSGRHEDAPCEVTPGATQTAVIKRKQVSAISSADRVTSMIIAIRHVRQHVSGEVMDEDGIGSQLRSSSAWRQKKTGAPTPDFLAFRLNWSSPDLDQIVAKR